ncbi:MULTISPECIES: hypothetical protein [unclassified Xanthomonas]|uniref:hypothetical protein n=1 Tax=unclassified Xanthomonas TaxID=2643310 RepID=UPI002A80B981|nr:MULTISPECIES: hypothetical protein [unclassified Xanthomonas]MDY4296795.1 hypothetical protein [Xanthomonas sp. LF02-5]MDY4358446.1 hypothetical protein [Xanthomonas sp. LF04-12]
MEWMYGVFQCAPLSKVCVLEWNAVAAIGGWASAVATLLAVLLPYRREVRRGRYRSYVALRAFRESLGRLSYRLDGVSSVRSTFADGDYQPKEVEIEMLLGLSIEIPLLDLDPELDKVLSAISVLRQRLAAWERVVSVLKLPGTERLLASDRFTVRLKKLAPMFDKLTTELHEAIEAAEAAIDGTKFALRKL